MYRFRLDKQLSSFLELLSYSYAEALFQDLQLINIFMDKTSFWLFFSLSRTINRRDNNIMNIFLIFLMFRRQFSIISIKKEKTDHSSPTEITFLLKCVPL